MLFVVDQKFMVISISRKACLVKYLERLGAFKAIPSTQNCTRIERQHYEEPRFGVPAMMKN